MTITVRKTVVFVPMLVIVTLYVITGLLHHIVDEALASLEDWSRWHA